MSFSARGAVWPLGFLAALSAAFLIPFTAPATGGPQIHFGQSSGEDVLEGRDPGMATRVAPRYGSHWSSPHLRGTYDGRHGWDRRPDVHREPGWNAYKLPRPLNHYSRSSRSITYVRTPPRSSYYRGTGIFANANPTGGSIVLVYPQGSDVWEEGSATGRVSAPKFIDVASERLDREPIGPDGISVHYSGSAKIIRIAPSYRMSDAAAAHSGDLASLPSQEQVIRYHEPSQPTSAPQPATAEPEASAAIALPPAAVAPSAPAVPPIPTQAPARPAAAAGDGRPTAPESASAPALEPWTDEWLRDCVARHDSFDASLGTYTDETGRRRFCTGDPA